MKKLRISFIIIFFSIIILSFFIDNHHLSNLKHTTLSFIKSMILLIPGIILLTSLFDVWVPRKIIEKHLGKDSGFMGYIWVIILSGTTVGGLLVALPVASSLLYKGAKLRIVFSYISFATVCRLPMTLYEISYMGIKFTIIRWFISIPLIIISSIILEKIGEIPPKYLSDETSN